MYNKGHQKIDWTVTFINNISAELKTMRTQKCDYVSVTTKDKKIPIPQTLDLVKR